MDDNKDQAVKDWEGVKAEEDDGQGVGSEREELLRGLHEAAQGAERDDDGANVDVETTGSDTSSASGDKTSFGSSSDSSLSLSSSSESETGDKDRDMNEDSANETEVDRTESPLKRLKRKHPTIFGDDAPPTKPKTSVATRNPPPPELEGQFRFHNSIIWQVEITRCDKRMVDVDEGPREYQRIRICVCSSAA